MKPSPTVLISGCALLLLGLGGIDRYLFARRLARMDPKYFYHDVQTLVRRVQPPETQSSGSSHVLRQPQTESYKVVVATDRLIVFYTRSFTSSAYLTFSRPGADDTWRVGWLRGGTFSQVGTFTF
jgi:hypothetical protein